MVGAKSRPGRPPRKDGPDFSTVGALLPSGLDAYIGPQRGRTTRIIELLRAGLDDTESPNLQVRKLSCAKKGYLAYVVWDLDDPEAPKIFYVGELKRMSAQLATTMAAAVRKPSQDQIDPSITVTVVGLLHRGLKRKGAPVNSPRTRLLKELGVDLSSLLPTGT